MHPRKTNTFKIVHTQQKYDNQKILQQTQKTNECQRPEYNPCYEVGLASVWVLDH